MCLTIALQIQAVVVGWEIFKITNADIKLNPILSSGFPTAAKRPNYSVLDKSKIKTTFNISIPYWKDSLEKCIERLK